MTQLWLTDADAGGNAIGSLERNAAGLEHPMDRIKVVGYRYAPALLEISNGALGYLRFLSQVVLRPFQPSTGGSTLFGR